MAARVWLRKALTDVPQDRPQSKHSAEPGDVKPVMAPRVAYGSTERLRLARVGPTTPTHSRTLPDWFRLSCLECVSRVEQCGDTDGSVLCMEVELRDLSASRPPFRPDH